MARPVAAASPAVRRLGIVLGLASCAQLALFGIAVWRSAVLLPYSDDIDWVILYLRRREVGSFLDYLWRFDNEHHLVWIRLLSALDVGRLGARGLAFIAAATAAMLLTAWLCLSELRRAGLRGGWLAPLGLLAPMLLLTVPNAADCGIHVNAVYPLTVVFCVAALVAFDGEAERDAASGLRRVAALVLAAAAGLANGAGLVIWPVLLWAAWRGGAGRAWLAAIAVAGVAYGALYLHGAPAPVRAAAWGGGAHPAKMAAYLLAYLGLPLARAQSLAVLRLPTAWLGALGRVLGLLLLLAGGAAFLRLGLLARRCGRMDRIALGLVLVAVATAVLAAIGRVNQSTGVLVPMRYTPFVSLLHVGLLCLVLPRLRNWAVTAGRARLLLAGGTVLAVALLAQQVVLGQATARAADHTAAVVRRFYAGARSPEMRGVVYPDLARAERYRAIMREHGLPRGLPGVRPR